MPIWFYNDAPSYRWLMSIWGGDVKDTTAETLNEAERNLIMTHDLLLLAVAIDFCSKLPPCFLTGLPTSGLPSHSQVCLLAWTQSIHLSTYASIYQTLIFLLIVHFILPFFVLSLHTFSSIFDKSFKCDYIRLMSFWMRQYTSPKRRRNVGVKILLSEIKPSVPHER